MNKAIMKSKMSNLIKYLIIFSFLIFTSCEELVKTQIRTPIIIPEDNILTLPADGESWIKVNVDFLNLLSSDQEISITVSDGSIHKLNELDFDVDTKSLTAKPNSKNYSFILRSGKIPNNAVILSVSVNDIVTTKLLRFERVCPEDIFLEFDRNDISLQEGNSIIGTFLLRNDTLTVSDSIQIQIIVTDESLVSYDPILFYESPQSMIEIKHRGDTGNVQIQAIINEPGCAENLMIQKEIFIVE